MPTQTSQNLSSEFLSELFKEQRTKEVTTKAQKVYFIHLDGINCPTVIAVNVKKIDELIETHVFNKEDQTGTLPRLRKK